MKLQLFAVTCVALFLLLNLTRYMRHQQTNCSDLIAKLILIFCKDGKVDGVPVWAAIYYCLRCGDAAATIQAAEGLP